MQWLEKNKNDAITQHQIFLNLFKKDSYSSYSTDWLINNQALDGYWQNTSLSLKGNADAFSTALAINALSLHAENKTIAAIVRAREWLLQELASLNRGDLAAALYFVFPSSEIKDVVAVTPAAVKVRSGERFELLDENKGLRSLNLTASYAGILQSISIEKDNFRRISFNATQENSFVILSYSGIYNVPVFVIKIIQGQETIGLNVTALPAIKFSGENEKSILEDESTQIKLKLINSNPKELKDVSLLVSKELYRILSLDRYKVDLPANSEIEILLIVNENASTLPGIYEGEITASDTITAKFPIRIEVLSSREEQREKDCYDYGYQCCEQPADDAQTFNYSCLSGICAEQCKGEGDEEQQETGAKSRVSPIVLIILAVIVASIVLLIVLNRRRKKPKKEGIEEIVEKIEGRQLKGLEKI